MMKKIGVTIEKSPSDWQIIQRDEYGLGEFTIGGTWATDQKQFWVQARLVDEQTNAPVTGHHDWRDAVLDIANEKFTLTFTQIPAGGLYRVETRIKRPFADDPRALRGDYIHHLGVGDIYIVAGQSNASGTGKGPVLDGPQLGVHVFANDEQWKLATHPLEDATRTLHPITITGIFHGHSPWLAFGKRILSATGIPVGLIPTALGGCAISMWVTDAGEPGVLFDNMMGMVTKAGGKVAGVLWHQGESDAHSEGVELYPQRFEKLVTLLRKKLHKPDLPIFTGQLNRVISDQQTPCPWSRMREIQRRLARQIERVYMAVTIDCSMSDEIHNNAAGCVLAGERYADLALKYVYAKPVQAHCPEPCDVRFDGSARQMIKIRFVNVSGDWTPNRITESFRVEDESGVIPIEKVDLGTGGEVHIHLSRPAGGSPMLHALHGVNPTITLRDDSCRPVTPFSLPVL
ncbi:MAG: sialate O-acetylesterase [Phycisphaerae bacterium]|jgi:sialate O-acetylesterase|nr:sialate O-acetylesterase [Phycisphaerae bacterium]